MKKFWGLFNIDMELKYMSLSKGVWYQTNVKWKYSVCSKLHFPFNLRLSTTCTWRMVSLKDLMCRELVPLNLCIQVMNTCKINCPTRFWKANRMWTMYVQGSETHIHSDYIVGHHHTLLKIIAEIVLHYIKLSKTSTESLT
jgi:hypothetical protein